MNQPYLFLRLAPSLGFFMIYHALKRMGHEVDFCDLYYEHLPPLRGYDMVALSGIASLNFPCIKWIADMCRKRKIYCIAGGPAMALVEKAVARHVDCVVAGNGLPLLARIIREKPQGILRSDPLPDMDELKTFYLDPPIELYLYYFERENYRYAMQSSLGCPNRCKFCLRPQLSGNKVLLIPPEIIRKHLEIMVNSCPEPINLYLCDDDFFGFPDHASQTLAIAGDMRDKFRSVGTRGTPYHKLFLGKSSFLPKLKGGGITNVGWGIENFDPMVRRRMGKPATALDIEPVLEVMLKNGITAAGSNILVGTPYENRASLLYTASKIKQWAEAFTTSTGELFIWPSAYIKAGNGNRMDGIEYRQLCPELDMYYAQGLYGRDITYLTGWKSMNYAIEGSGGYTLVSKPFRMTDERVGYVSLSQVEYEGYLTAVAIINNTRINAEMLHLETKSIGNKHILAFNIWNPGGRLLEDFILVFKEEC
jgi:hypothetical protein